MATSPFIIGADFSFWGGEKSALFRLLVGPFEVAGLVGGDRGMTSPFVFGPVVGFWEG